MKSELRKVNALYDEIRTVLEKTRLSAYKAINRAMVQAYWHIGRLIVENEQKGKEKAEYGKRILEGVSNRLTSEFGKGYTVRNLRYMRQFFLTFSKRNALRAKSRYLEKSYELDLNILRPELSWTHYRLLLRVENEKARDWYMNEAADQNWSTRQLDRQISVLYYERLLSSREKKLVKQEADKKIAALEPEHFIRDPYVLEFLGDLRKWLYL